MRDDKTRRDKHTWTGNFNIQIENIIQRVYIAVNGYVYYFTNNFH